MDKLLGDATSSDIVIVKERKPWTTVLLEIGNKQVACMEERKK